MSHIPYNNQIYLDVVEGETNWNKESLQPIKNMLRDYLYTINSERCFFCKEKIDEGTRDETIEHLVCKNDYPIFTFKPKNLTLACLDCNSNKLKSKIFSNSVNTNQILKNNKYPFSKEDYIIIHPYIDNYEEYIDIDDIFYISKGAKGAFTIKLYGLTRLSLAERKIKKSISSKRSEVKQSVLNQNSQNVDVNKYFSCGVLIKYINNKINTRGGWSSEIKQYVKNLSNTSVNILKFFKEKPKDRYLVKEYYILERCVRNSLTILDNITRKPSDRRELYVLLDLDYESVYNFFEDYYDRRELNEQLNILFKFKFLISIIKLYDVSGYEMPNLRRGLESDISLINILFNSG